MKNNHNPCPFCKSAETYYEVDEFDDGYIICRNCGAQGPKVKATRGANSKAARLWRKAASE